MHLSSVRLQQILNKTRRCTSHYYSTVKQTDTVL